MSFAAPVSALGKSIVIFVTIVYTVVVAIVVCIVSVPVLVVSAVAVAVSIVTIILMTSMIHIKALFLDVSVLVVLVPVVIVTRVALSSVPVPEFVMEFAICLKYWRRRPINSTSGVKGSSCIVIILCTVVKVVEVVAIAPCRT